MTTPKPYHALKPSVAFGKPTVGPRVYLARGPSGWPEQFSRKLADKALDDFLAPLSVEEVLQTFTATMQLESREETWGDVTGHLAKIVETPVKNIPEIVSVAFWGRYVIAKRNEGAN